MYIICTFVVMNTKTTISLDDKVKKAGQRKATENGTRGGFSGYIEQLIKKDLEEPAKKSTHNLLCQVPECVNKANFELSDYQLRFVCTEHLPNEVGNGFKISVL